ncbi:Transport inhibitor response 1-like protein [Drosera capensis]
MILNPLTRDTNLVELDIQENGIDDRSSCWLSCFPESLTSLEILNFYHLTTEVNFPALERLVARFKSLKVLMVNKNINLEQLQKLLFLAPQLTKLGTGSFSQELNSPQYEALRKLAAVPSDDLTKFLAHCPNLRRLWKIRSEAVGSYCLLEELRVFPTSPFDPDIAHEVTESVSYGCPRLCYVLYFCRQMTNAAVATIVKNCPDFTHMNPGQPDYLTNEPMDEAFGAVVKTCTKLRRLVVSGLLTDLTFKYIGEYAKNLETLSVAFAGRSDRGMQHVL